MCLSPGEFIFYVILWFGIIPFGLVAGTIFSIQQLIKISKHDAESRYENKKR